MAEEKSYGQILIVGTNNQNKIKEIREILRGIDIEIKSLRDAGIELEVEEDGETLEANALKKAREASKASGQWAIADDSGLEVDALGGRPGVYSARFAGPEGDAVKNNAKLLRELEGVPQDKRGARFRCVIAFAAPDGNEATFEGALPGRIAFETHPGIGFGYDPVFVVPEYEKTISEIGYEIKNRISHRAKALNNFKGWFEKFLNEGK